MHCYNRTTKHEKFTSEIGTICEDKKMGLNEHEEEMAYIALKFNTQYPIKELKSNVLSSLILQNMPFEQVSTNPDVEIYSLSLEDSCTLHFFNEVNSKKFIIASRNTRENAMYNANNCMFVYETLLKHSLKESGIKTEEVENESQYFNYLFQ